MEGVEVLRKESYDSRDKHFQAPPLRNTRSNRLKDYAEPEEDKNDEKEEKPCKMEDSSNSIRLVDNKEEEKKDDASVYFVELGGDGDIPEAQQDTATAVPVPIGSRLERITSRLAEETEESERIREMLQARDQDLEQLQQMLNKYDYKSIVEQLSLSQSAPAVEVMCNRYE
jgi:hypothetical protein